MTQRDEKYLQMTGSPVPRLICRFAVPAIVSMLISSIYNIVDTFFAGRLDTQSVAALGVVFSYMSLIQACAFFFGQGSGNFISRALGARRDTEAETMASTGFFFAMIFAALMAAICGIFIRPVLTLFGATPTVLPCAVSYFKWVLAGTPFIVGTFVLNNQMRFQGNARFAVWGILSGALLNVALDPLLMFGCGLGVEGAGLATAISQTCSFFLMLYLAGKGGGIRIKLQRFAPSIRIFKEISAGGLPSLARQGLQAAAVMVLNHCAGAYGDSSLAAFAIVGRVMHIAAAMVIGFGQGFQPVCGFNYGAKLYDRVRTGIRFCVMLSTIWCLLMTVLGEAFAPGIIGLFTRGDADVVMLGARVLRAQCLAFPLVGFITITNMYLQSTRQVWPALTIAVARHGLFLIPALLVGSLFGLGGIVAAQPASDVLTFLLALPLCLKAIHKMKD